MFCSQCGTKLSDSAKYCHSCGFNVGGSKLDGQIPQETTLNQAKKGSKSKKVKTKPSPDEYIDEMKQPYPYGMTEQEVIDHNCEVEARKLYPNGVPLAVEYEYHGKSSKYSDHIVIALDDDTPDSMVEIFEITASSGYIVQTFGRFKRSDVIHNKRIKIKKMSVTSVICMLMAVLFFISGLMTAAVGFIIATACYGFACLSRHSLEYIQLELRTGKTVQFPMNEDAIKDDPYVAEMFYIITHPKESVKRNFLEDGDKYYFSLVRKYPKFRQVFKTE